MRGAHLCARVERLAAEGLLDGAKDAGERLPALLAEERTGLAARREFLSQLGRRGARVVQGEARGRNHRLRGLLAEALLVVLEQQPPGTGVALHHVEHGLALVRDEGVGRERAGQQLDGLSRLAQPAFRQPPLVQGVAAQQVVAERARRPDAELGAA